jgi:hypothetical protein
MTNIAGGRLRTVTTGGVTGSHPDPGLDDAMLAPTLVAEKNTLRAPLVPIACFRADDVRFDFDSSFPLPGIVEEMTHLSALRDLHKAADPDSKEVLFPPFSIFGHADPTGDDEYNKILSGRRAIAIFALLTRDTTRWNSLYTHALGGDNWRKNAVPIMKANLPQFANASDDPAEGQRKAMFAAYMDLVCPFQLQPADFLARCADSGGKGDYQGCSSFNPKLVFSAEEAQQFADPKNKLLRDGENAPNRRVMVFLFRPGSKVDPAKWPCPRAREKTPGCRARFFHKGDERRKLHLPLVRRLYDDTQDTFSCRFYDRLANDSPCEHAVLVSLLTLRIMDGDDKIFPNLPYTLRVFGDGTDGSEDDVIEGVTNAEGILQQPVPATATSAQIALFQPGVKKDDSTLPLWQVTMHIAPLLPSDTLAGLQARLNNLGLFASEAVDPAKVDKIARLPLPDHTKPDSPLDQLKRALKRFQNLYKPHGEQEPAEGNMDDETKAELEKRHGC